MDEKRDERETERELEEAAAPKSEELEAEAPAERKNAKERLYDKIPLTVRQVDLLIGAVLVFMVLMIVFGMLR